jgi:hypothetical protein
MHEPSNDDVPPPPDDEDEVVLLELLDRVLDKGAVLSGDITLSVAEVDLVHVSLQVLISSVETVAQGQVTTETAPEEQEDPEVSGKSS